MRGVGGDCVESGWGGVESVRAASGRITSGRVEWVRVAPGGIAGTRMTATMTQ